MSIKQRRRRPHRSLAAEVIRKAYDDARRGEDVNWDSVKPWADHLNLHLPSIREAAQKA
jgi:hypothetical protein